MFEHIKWIRSEPNQACITEEQGDWLIAEVDRLRATTARLTTACETALRHIVRRNWKGTEARAALIALSDALATTAPDSIQNP